MPTLGDLARAFGYAELSGVGTAEEQRKRRDEQARLAEQAAERRQRAEETAFYHREILKQREEQNAPVDLTDMANQILDSLGYEKRPKGSMTVPRWAAPSALGVLERSAASPGVIDYDQTTGEEVGYRRPGQPRTMIPGTPAVLSGPEEVGGPDTAGSEASRVLTPEVPGRPAASIREGSYPTVLERIRRTREDASKKAEKDAENEAIQKVKRLVSQGADLQAALGSVPETSRFPTVDWERVVYGGKLAPPEKDPGIRIGAGGEIIQPTPGQGAGFKVLREGDAKARADERKLERERRETSDLDRQQSTWDREYQTARDGVMAGVSQRTWDKKHLPDRVYKNKYGQEKGKSAAKPTGPADETGRRISYQRIADDMFGPNTDMKRLNDAQLTQIVTKFNEMYGAE